MCVSLLSLLLDQINNKLSVFGLKLEKAEYYLLDLILALKAEESGQLLNCLLKFLSEVN